MKNLKTILFSVVIVFALFSISCSSDDVADQEIDEVVEENEDETIADDSDFVPTDWTVDTHTTEVDPNIDEVFEDNTVKRLDFVIRSDLWQTMLDDMTNTYGTFGSSSGGPGLTETDEDPVFVPGEVYYEGKQWYKVGLRFKGNSSLQSTWGRGNLKLSFKMDFDEFEDDYPQIDNQRFFGFKKFSLKNNYDDKSLMREKVAGDVFRNAGLAAPHSAFYTLYVDYGDGPQYFGLYTLVEEVDGSVLDIQFSDDNGNLYKPDGDAASFASGTYDEGEYEKKNNEDEADFTDVSNLLSILHDNTRTTDAATWRANLDAIFDTDVFLKYLAINTAIQNWDTYGLMTHNYYLYNNSDTNKLTWIPWDNNEALQDGKRGGALELDFSDMYASEWPLIGYLYQDEVYRQKYDTYLQEVIDNSFNEATIQALYSSYETLLEPYATTEESGFTFLRSSSEFYSAVSQLKTHVTSRKSAVNNYLN